MTHVTAEVKAKVEAKLRTCHAMAEAHYNRKFDFPSISYTVRGTTAGTATGSKQVNFNPVLLMENTDLFISRTVPHELAHCLDYVINPQNHTRTWSRRKRVVHGADWKRVMAVIGAADATRCHKYDTANARVKQKVRHEWVCNDCAAKMELGPKRHNKMRAAGARGSYRPSGSGCSWNHTYRYVGVVGAPKPVALPKAAQTAAPKATASHKSPTKGSKKDRAETLYLVHKGSPRPDIIAIFVSQLDMTAAGAATYYANCKKKFG